MFQPTRTLDEEKLQTEHLEHASNSQADIEVAGDNDRTEHGYLHQGTAFEKKLMRKIDLRLIPALGRLDFMSHLDCCSLHH